MGATTSVPATTVPSPVHRRWHADVAGVVVVLLLTALAAWVELRGFWSLTDVDIVIFFLPFYGFLGEQLRAGHLPGWNPYQFGGAPFAGDAGSGWMYLPAMLLFTALPKLGAMKALIAFHLTLSGLSTYALARALRMSALAAVVAASAYEFGATLEYTRCCTVYVEVTAWLPVALLGVELAARSDDWVPRIAAWTGAGFAISQILAAYLGQGAAYALLLIAAFIAYRTLVSPVSGRAALRARCIDLIGHGAAILLIALGLAAAGLLPRLAANAQSTVAGGFYRDIPTVETVKPGWTVRQALDELLSGSANHQRYYLGGATLALALLAPLLARRRHATPFFAGASLVAAILTLKPTPLHRILYLIPRFEVLHRHYPSRALIIFNLGPALLAGATITALMTWRGHRWRLVALGLAPLALLLIIRATTATKGAPISVGTVIVVAAAAALVAIVAGAPAARTSALVLLLAAVLADPAGWTFVTRYEARARQNSASAALLHAYRDDTQGAAGFLKTRQRTQTFRYAGYDPLLIGPDGIYYAHFGRPGAPAVLVNNRATYIGLDDISGYNPMQPARYRDLIDALNSGVTQNYHQTNLLPTGFFSPLLDLLGVRYIVVPVNERETAIYWRELVKAYPTVYRNQTVRVLENPYAFPRAWIVHDARVDPPGESLRLMTSGTIDLRHTAVLETTPPAMSAPERGQIETVTVNDTQPDWLRVVARASAPGLLMVSDTYDPGWQVTVDGKPSRLLLADHALRAVAIPAGIHVVEMHFVAQAARVGLVITATTAAGIVALLMLCWVGPTWRDPGRGRDRVARRRCRYLWATGTWLMAMSCNVLRRVRSPMCMRA